MTGASRGLAEDSIRTGDRIRSRADLLRFQRADAKAHGMDHISVLDLVRNHALRWQRSYRRAEYLRNCWTGVGRILAAIYHLRVHYRAARLGFTLPLNVAGPGLCIVHWGTLVVSGEAELGSDVRLHPGVSIGVHRGRAPVVGDHARIGPGAKIVGGVVVGDGANIGANAVVTRDVPPWCVAVGVPARVLPSRSTADELGS